MHTILIFNVLSQRLGTNLKGKNVQRLNKTKNKDLTAVHFPSLLYYLRFKEILFAHISNSASETQLGTTFLSIQFYLY